MPIKIQWEANWCPIECQLRSKQMPIVIQYDAYLDPIRRQLRSNPITIEIHSNTNRDPIWPNWYTIWWTQCHLSSKMLDWLRFRVIRVPPLKTFWGTSRPMRNQHFELSTNQKPRFRPDSRCWSKLESTNLTPMCQLTYNRVALDYKWNAHWLPTKGRLTTNGISIDCQWNVNRLPMKCQLNSNGMPIEFQLKANWIPMECQFNTNSKILQTIRHAIVLVVLGRTRPCRIRLGVVRPITTRTTPCQIMFDC